MTRQECHDCGKEFEAEMKCKYCNSCNDDRAMSALSKVEPPEGGWPRGSDMDRL